jgi:hypothetical protein
VSVIEEEMAMETGSTDRRIDDLAARADRFEGDVKVRFDKMDREFAKADHRRERFEDKVEERFERVATKEELSVLQREVDVRFAAVDARFDKLEARFDDWGKVVVGGVATIVVAIVSAVVLKLFGV